jgi:hypothetical protein
MAAVCSAEAPTVGGCAVFEEVELLCYATGKKNKQIEDSHASQPSSTVRDELFSVPKMR